jgi:8-amino-7-oxononanoate synthase
MNDQIAQLAQLGLFRIPASRMADRTFVSAGQTFDDFCSTNYLGFDFEPLIRQLANEHFDEWGILAPWSRMEVDSPPYLALEEKIAELLGAEKSLLGPSITMINFSCLPTIAGRGVILADRKLHTVVWEACRLARDHGATIHRFAHQDLENLHRLLEQNRHISPIVIAIDGVYSVSGAIAPLKEIQALARQYEAWIYVDDAHGFGILGGAPEKDNEWGSGGQGIVAHSQGDYARTFYVSSLGKALCVPVAFCAIATEWRGDLSATATHYLFSAPVSPLLVGAANAALQLNHEKGDGARARIRNLVQRFLSGARSSGLPVSNNKLLPMVYLNLGEFDALTHVARQLIEAGIVAGWRAYPVVPPDQCGLRLAFNANNTEEQVDRLLAVLRGVSL